jgi:hypothetical protein
MVVIVSTHLSRCDTSIWMSTSCQNRINLSQNKIGLPREQLKVIENGDWKLEIKLYMIAQKMLGINWNILSCWIKIEHHYWSNDWIFAGNAQKICEQLLKNFGS